MIVYPPPLYSSIFLDIYLGNFDMKKNRREPCNKFTW